MTKASKRSWLRWSRGLLLAFVLLHLASFLYFSWFTTPPPVLNAGPVVRNAEQERAYQALYGILREDRVPEAAAWADAIVRHSPALHPAYLAIVTAQIRRESHFLQEDLEWLFNKLVPDLVHEIGIRDPIYTIGAMQLNRYRFSEMIRDETGRDLSDHQVKRTAYDLEAGAHYCIRYLDALIRRYVPDRGLLGWRDLRGPEGLDPKGARNQFPIWPSEEFAQRSRIAAFQKLLSDLSGQPLVLDGALGPRSLAAAKSIWPTEAIPQLEADFARSPADFGGCTSELKLRAQWQAWYETEPPEQLFPRLAHDPRLVFVFADFNSGIGASEITALQYMLNRLGDEKLALDGKLGPLTRAAMRRFLIREVDDERRRADFMTLLKTGHKPQWLRQETARLARQRFEQEFGESPPTALLPDLQHGGLSQSLKGIGRISVRDYVAGSVYFFEHYLIRLQRRLDP